MGYQLLDAFRSVFDGQAYLHRKSNLGDSVAMHLYEDLHSLARSKKFVSRADTGISVLNTQNRRHGIKARRGDGSFGEIVPNVDPIKDKGFVVSRGPIATIEIGIEVKILMKAMIKQIDRVTSDLKEQAAHFRSRGGKPICMKYKHPIDEAQEAEKRLLQLAAPAFDEFLVLRFEAMNEPPYAFAWTNEKATLLDYGAILARISQQYELRF